MRKKLLLSVIAGAFCLSLVAGDAALTQKAFAEDHAFPETIRLAQLDGDTDDNPAVRGKIYVPMQTAPSDLNLVAVGTIKEVLKSNLVKMADGKVFSLTNLRVPVLYESLAKKVLKEFVGQKVGLYQRDFPGVSLNDRYGNLSGHLVTDKNDWLQAKLILKGVAWATSTPENRDMVRKLYQYEALARTNKSGFWGTATYAVKSADSVLEGCSNTFQVVEDVIKSYKTVGKDYYFNFGPNPATDFTFIMPQKLVGSFVTEKNQAFAPWKWVNQRIRVRGWVTYTSGALIEVDHPEQIEFVGMESRLQRYGR